MSLTHQELPTVIVADPMHSSGIDRLKMKFRVVMPDAFDTGDAETCRAASAIIVRTFKVTDELLCRMPNLRIVAKHGSGVDNIDIDAASRRKIVVANTPGESNATSVAEGAVTLMLGVLHRLKEIDAAVRHGNYEARWTLMLGNLWQKDLGLVGFGNIARHVSGICGSGFRMHVRAFDPFVSREDMRRLSVEKSETLEELLESSDVISLHAPLAASTRHMIGSRELSLMKRSAILVNTARGGLIDEKSLVQVLRDRRIRGAGLDVFEVEPPLPGNPLFELDNVLLSPHVVSSNEDGRRSLSERSAELVEGCLGGTLPPTTLNRAAVA